MIEHLAFSVDSFLYLLPYYLSVVRSLIKPQFCLDFSYILTTHVLPPVNLSRQNYERDSPRRVPFSLSSMAN
jgi:hypothetical protein